MNTFTPSFNDEDDSGDNGAISLCAESRRCHIFTTAGGFPNRKKFWDACLVHAFVGFLTRARRRRRLALVWPRNSVGCFQLKKQKECSDWRQNGPKLQHLKEAHKMLPFLLLGFKKKGGNGTEEDVQRRGE